MSFSSDNPALSTNLGDFETPDNFDEFTDVFEREYKRLIDTVNAKESGYYGFNETITQQQYYDADDPQGQKVVYRKVIDFGALPNGTTKRVSHGLTLDSSARITRLYGGATNPIGPSFIPLPFSSPTLNLNVTLEADEQDIIITTVSDYTQYRNTSVVFEYTRS